MHHSIAARIHRHKSWCAQPEDLPQNSRQCKQCESALTLSTVAGHAYSASLVSTQLRVVLSATTAPLAAPQMHGAEIAPCVPLADSAVSRLPAFRPKAATNTGCKVCLSGTFAALGSDVCSLCPAGRAAGAESEQCASCPAGRSAATGSDVCTVCGPGTKALPESEKCTVCPAGKFDREQLAVRAM